MRPSYHSPLAALVHRTPVTAPPEIPLREAVRLMSQHRVGSIIIADPVSSRPLGIFTIRDLLHRVAAVSCDLDQTLSHVMSASGLLTLDTQATVYEAALLMARHGVHHVIIVDAAGRVAGVVSQDNIHELQSGGGKDISAAIREARDMDSLAAAAGAVRKLAETLLAEGTAAEPLTQLISTLNDHLTVRIIELTQVEFALPDIEWCWLAFGSEGRFEQTLSTDQDNGLAFAVTADTGIDAARAALVPFARAVNERLATCGFPLCKGNIMAGNLELCLSLDEWQARFKGWLAAGNPQALLSASIYFDFRPLYGNDGLATKLRAWLLNHIPAAALFQRLMAEIALQTAPPLATFREFTFDGNRAFPHTLDLKAGGARLFVDAARILALAAGIAQTGTAQRLRALGDTGRLGGEDVAALVDGFFFIQQLRLRAQQGGSMAGSANRVDPDSLNELDRHVLKEAFRQARKLQERLRLEYRL